MALVLNLRGDLAKLGDAELADRLADAWHRHDSIAKRRAWFGGPSWPLWSTRGPIRHPRVYRFLAGVEAMPHTGHWIEWLMPLALSSKLTDRLMERYAEREPWLVLCEIRDIMDEMKRRVDARKASTQ